MTRRVYLGIVESDLVEIVASTTVPSARALSLIHI